MTPDGLREYLSKYGLSVPKECITDKFLLTLHEKIQNNVVVSTSSRKRRNTFNYGLRDLSVSNNHWVSDLKGSSFRITKPTIICLPGNVSITCEKANGFCKMIEGCLGLNHDCEYEESGYKLIDILGVHYGTDDETQTVGTITEKESKEVGYIEKWQF